jgi:hypothetical protein
VIQQSHLTVGQIADFYGKPAWLVRRVVDSLDIGVERVGLYRLVPRDALPMIGAELARHVPRTKPEAVAQ